MKPFEIHRGENELLPFFYLHSESEAIQILQNHFNVVHCTFDFMIRFHSVPTLHV